MVQANLARDLLYTDGVKHFAESAGDHGAYWFLDTVALYIYPLLKKEPFLVINLQVNNCSSGVIKVDDGNDNEVLPKQFLTRMFKKVYGSFI